MKKIFLLCLLIQKSYASCPYSGNWSIDVNHSQSNVYLSGKFGMLSSATKKPVPLVVTHKLKINDDCRIVGMFFFTNSRLSYVSGQCKILGAISLTSPIVEKNSGQSLKTTVDLYHSKKFGIGRKYIGCSVSDACCDGSRIFVLSQDKLRIDVNTFNKKFRLTGSIYLYKE